jgi:glutamate-1-semialdehyde 2,1-aminomutase
LEKNTRYLVEELKAAAHEQQLPIVINHTCGLFGIFFTDQEKITNLDSVQQCDVPMFQQFFHQMLQQGIYLAPSAFECGFVSGAHKKQELDQTVLAASKTFAAIKQGL